MLKTYNFIKFVEVLFIIKKVSSVTMLLNLFIVFYSHIVMFRFINLSALMSALM